MHQVSRRIHLVQEVLPVQFAHAYAHRAVREKTTAERYPFSRAPDTKDSEPLQQPEPENPF